MIQDQIVLQTEAAGLCKEEGDCAHIMGTIVEAAPKKTMFHNSIDNIDNIINMNIHTIYVYIYTHTYTHA